MRGRDTEKNVRRKTGKGINEVNERNKSKKMRLREEGKLQE